MNGSRMPTYFLSHGGGPWPWLKTEMPFYAKLEESLHQIPSKLGQIPKAILIISGHWEEKQFAVTSGANPPMIYDYSGFPEHTYQIQYLAPGSPKLARRVQSLIQKAGFDCALDEERGFDHGAFVVAFACFPKADIPIIQLSMKQSYDPEEHLAVGRALAPLRDEGVLLLGSGGSFHNLRTMMTRDPSATPASKNFDNWLHKTLIETSPKERSERLSKWLEAPSARQAHPREEHLIPLMVAVGAAEEEHATEVYHEDDFMGALTVSSFRFGDDKLK